MIYRMWKKYNDVLVYYFMRVHYILGNQGKFAFMQNSGRILDSKGTVIHGYMNKDTPP